eukprot:scaffold48_cov311-Pinguiococcus_pyrenoidosus.AAC.318
MTVTEYFSLPISKNVKDINSKSQASAFRQLSSCVGASGASRALFRAFARPLAPFRSPSPSLDTMSSQGVKVFLGTSAMLALAAVPLFIKDKSTGKGGRETREFDCRSELQPNATGHQQTTHITLERTSRKRWRRPWRR